MDNIISFSDKNPYEKMKIKDIRNNGLRGRDTDGRNEERSKIDIIPVK